MIENIASTMKKIGNIVIEFYSDWEKLDKLNERQKKRLSVLKEKRHERVEKKINNEKEKARKRESEGIRII